MLSLQQTSSVGGHACTRAQNCLMALVCMAASTWVCSECHDVSKPAAADAAAILSTQVAGMSQDQVSFSIIACL